MTDKDFDRINSLVAEPGLKKIGNKIMAGERISPSEGIMLFEHV